MGSLTVIPADSASALCLTEERVTTTVLERCDRDGGNCHFAARHLVTKYRLCLLCKKSRALWEWEHMYCPHLTRHGRVPTNALKYLKLCHVDK